MPSKSQGRGDATGARSGHPCQAVLYYNTQLAFCVSGRLTGSVIVALALMRAIFCQCGMYAGAHGGIVGAVGSFGCFQPCLWLDAQDIQSVLSLLGKLLEV